MSSVEFYHPGSAKWVACSGGTWPSNAILSGIDNGAHLYVARANYKGALLPGKLHAGHRTCYVSWGGDEISIPSYEVLVAAPGELRWGHSSRGQLVRHAVVGGKSETGDQLFIGRVHYKGSNIPGKVHPQHGVCYIPYGGKEISSETYEILHG